MTGRPEEEKIAVSAFPVNGIESDVVPKAVFASDAVDAAFDFVQPEGTAVLTEIDEKALVRKIDWMIMPLMWACYNLQYLDKVLSMSQDCPPCSPSCSSLCIGI
jgi:hypothetical protein